MAEKEQKPQEQINSHTEIKKEKEPSINQKHHQQDKAESKQQKAMEPSQNHIQSESGIKGNQQQQMKDDKKEQHPEQKAGSQKTLEKQAKNQKQDQKINENQVKSQAKIQAQQPSNSQENKQVHSEEKKENQQVNQKQVKVGHKDPSQSKKQITEEKKQQQGQKGKETQEKKQVVKPQEKKQVKKQSQDQKEKKEDKNAEEKKVQPIKELTPTQYLEEYFRKYKSSQNKQIKQKLINYLNAVVGLKLPITSQILNAYLKSKQEQHSLQQFKEWAAKEEQKQIQIIKVYFGTATNQEEINNNKTKLTELLKLANSDKSVLSAALGVGEAKGKTWIKYALSLKQATEQVLSVTIDLKIKKKLQLRTLIQNDLRKIYKSQGWNPLKFCKIVFTETDKTLKIQISSKIYQELVFKDLIDLMAQIYEQHKKPVLKIDGQLQIKSSLCADQQKLSNKLFIKWLAQSFTAKMHIEGNTAIIKHITSPFVDLFPILKVVRSGQINLKMKNPQNIDKLFDKLGINQICQQTPTLSVLIQEIVGSYLQSNGLPWISDILKRSIFFASTIPNQKIGCEINAVLSHLHLSFSIGADACKQLGDIFYKSSIQLFS